MDNRGFSDDEKKQLSTKIEEMYFKNNFGSVNKSDFELLLFSEYVEHCKNVGRPFDDYSLAKDLGITPSRVRTLKEKKALKYPDVDYDWKKAFAEKLKNAKYEKGTDKFKIAISDKYLMNEICSNIEDKGWYYDCSGTGRVLTIPVAGLVDIFLEDVDFTTLIDKQKKSKLNKIVKGEKSIKDFITTLSKESFLSALKSVSKDMMIKVIRISGLSEFLENVFEQIIQIIGNF